MVKSFVLGEAAEAASPFQKIGSLLTKISGDVTTNLITIFVIGFCFCAFMVWKGDEENAPRFKKGLIGCGLGVIVFTLASVIVNYIKAGVSTP